MYEEGGLKLVFFVGLVLCKWVIFVGHVSNAEVYFLACMLTGLGCFKKAMWCWRWAKRVCSIGRWIGSSLGSWASLVYVCVCTWVYVCIYVCAYI